MNLRNVLKELGKFDINRILQIYEERGGKITDTLRYFLEELLTALQEQGFVNEDLEIDQEFLKDPDLSLLVDIELTEEKPEIIPIAGVVIPELEFIVDPISETEYLITDGDKTEIKEIETREIKGKKGGVKRVDFYISDSEGNEIMIDGPVTELKYIPNRIRRDIIEDFDEINETELYNEITKYIQRYIDAYEKYHHLGALFIFQSWVADVLPSVFYLAVKAPFGGGKTTFGSTIAYVSKVGMATSDISTASIARRIHYLRPTIFLDEMDQLDTDVRTEFLRILRIGQRREGAWYERARSDGSTVSFFVFGPKIFSVHSEIEEALSQRCFSINLYPTKNVQYVFENLSKDKVVPYFYTKMLLWRHTVGLKHLIMLKYARTITKDGMVYYNLPFLKNALRFVIEATKGLGLSGRNAELLLIISEIAAEIGILEQIKTHLTEIIKEKISEDELLAEREYKVLLREIILKLYRAFYKYVNGDDEIAQYFEGIRREDLLSSEGYIQIPIELINSIYRQKLRKEGMNLGSRKYAAILRELGLYDAFRNTKRKMVGIEFDERARAFVLVSPATKRRVLLITEDVAKKLGIEELVKKNASLDMFGGEQNEV